MILNALEQTQAVIGIIDGCIVHWSPGAERLYGWTANEVIGSRAQDLLQQKGAGAAQVSAMEADRPETGKPGIWNAEFSRAHKDGRELAIAAYRVTHRDRGGQATIIELNDLIEPAEHTREAQPTPVRQTEANGCPPRRMAHDFNNLLGIITLNLELARERAGGGEVRDMIDEALDAAWQGSELTRNLADLARCQPG